MSEISRVSLRKVVPEANMFRQYSVAVSRDLFGQPLVTCAWGRIGSRGQEQRHVCGTQAEAEALAQKLVLRRLRRGYVAVEQGGARGAARPSADLSQAAAAAAPRPPRRRAGARQNPAQLCLLTWLQPVIGPQASAAAEAPSEPEAARWLRKPASPFERRARAGAPAMAEALKPAFKRGATQASLRRALLGLAASGSSARRAAEARPRI